MSAYNQLVAVNDTFDLPPAVLGQLDDRYEAAGSLSAGIAASSLGMSTSASASANLAALQSGIDSSATFGVPVVVGPGTFSMVSALYFPAGSHLVMSPGTVLDFTASGASSYLNVLGSAASPVSLSGSPSMGSKTITASGLGVAAGDWIYVQSDDLFDSYNTDIGLGELVQVRSVSGNTITLWTALCDTYATNPRASKCAMVDNVTIEGGQIRGDYTPNAGRSTVLASFTTNFTMRNVHSAGVDRRHVGIANSVNALVDRCFFEWTAHASTGYGVSFQDATRDSACTRSRFLECRHSLSTNNNTVNGGIPRRIRFAYNLVESSALATGGTGGDAIDTHGAAEDIWIEYNTVNGSSGQGINVECKSGWAIGNRIFDCVSNGICYHNESDRGGTFICSGNMVSRVGDHGIFLRGGIRGTDTANHGTVCSDNVVLNAAKIGIAIGSLSSHVNRLDRNVTITGNTVRQAGEHGIVVRRADTVVEQGNSVYDCGQGMLFDDVLYASIGPSVIRTFTVVDNFVGISLTAVTRSRVQPGAMRCIGGTDSIGVVVGAGCADMTVGKTGHLFADTKFSNVSGSPSVVFD